MHNNASLRTQKIYKQILNKLIKNEIIKKTAFFNSSKILYNKNFSKDELMLISSSTHKNKLINNFMIFKKKNSINNLVLVIEPINTLSKPDSLFFKNLLDFFNLLICSDSESKKPGEEKNAYLKIIINLADNFINSKKNNNEIITNEAETLSGTVINKSELIRRITHELKSPLVIMNNYLELLNAKMLGDYTQKQKQAFNKIEYHIKKSLNNIANFKKFIMSEESDYSFQIETFLIKDFLNSAIYLFKKRIKNKKLKLNIKFSSSNLKFRSERAYLFEAIKQIIDNAVEFSPKNSTIHIYAMHKNKEFILTVKDNGPGIPEKELKNIFNPFYQYENIKTRKKQGVGMGLTIVQSIIKRLNGKIEVKSNIGKGFKISIILPERYENNL